MIILSIAAVFLAVLCTLMAPLSIYLALFAPMAMDAPGSEHSPGKWCFVAALFIAPLVLIPSVWYAWAAILNARHGIALGWCGVGLLPLALGWYLLENNWFDKKKPRA